MNPKAPTAPSNVQSDRRYPHLAQELAGGTAGDDHPMALLLEEEAAAYPEIRRGEIIEGVVVGTDRDAILVDIGAKSEGVVPPAEMHCLQPEGPPKLSIGDKVLVFVIQPESPEGQIVLSLDRARGERGWRVLQDYMDENQAFEGYVTGANKGGLLVNVEGVNAFVPLSQLVSGPDRGSPENTQQKLGEWVGKNITLKVIEVNRRRNRAILSERAAMQERRAAEKERLLLELHEGDVRTGRITSIRDFGIFVDIGGADGLVHLSELSWERTPKSPHEFFSVGEEVPVYIMKVDGETKKIALSVRRAQPERWEEIVSNYREGQIVPGQVTKLAPFGAFVKLEGPIEGLIHISELVDRRINHPQEVIEEDAVVPVKIVRIEYDRHRLGLSLRQAREKAEEDGWGFSEGGSVTSVPQDVLDTMGVTMAPPVADEGEGEVEAAVVTGEETEASAEAVDATPLQVAVEESAGEETVAAAEPAAEPVAEDAAAEEPDAVADEPVVEGVVAAEPDAVADEPVVEDAAGEEPEAVADDPVVEDAAGEEPEAVAAEPTVEEAAPEAEVAADVPAAEAPVVEAEAEEQEVVAAEPVVEEAAAETSKEETDVVSPDEGNGETAEEGAENIEAVSEYLPTNDDEGVTNEAAETLNSVDEG